MKWENFKDELKCEWDFYKRNPEFPLLMLLYIGLLIYFITKQLL